MMDPPIVQDVSTAPPSGRAVAGRRAALTFVAIAALLLIPTVGAASASESPASGAREARLVFLGDSLTAGFGLGEEQAYPAILERRLDEAGLPVEVVNAGVSGDTSAGGLRRIDWVLKQEPDVLVVALGGNDGLRALPVDQLEGNLREIIRKAREAGARVLLLGVRMPPSHGQSYKSAFEAVYPRIAEDMDVPLVRYMLEGVAGDPSLNQPDGIHPTAEGQRVIADNVYPALARLLRRNSEEEAS